MAADAASGADLAPRLDAPRAVETIQAWVQSVIDREFHSLRTQTPRSDPYIEGFRNGLEQRIAGKARAMVYQSGTAAADAYLAGKEEARDFTIDPATLDQLQALLSSPSTDAQS